MIVRDAFVVDICYCRKRFTPQQIVDYIANTSGEGYADTKELKDLILQSSQELQKIVGDAKLKMDQALDTSTDVGRKIAGLALKHCDETIRLIQEGGWRSGAMI